MPKQFYAVHKQIATQKASRKHLKAVLVTTTKKCALLSTPVSCSRRTLANELTTWAVVRPIVTLKLLPRKDIWWIWRTKPCQSSNRHTENLLHSSSFLGEYFSAPQMPWTSKATGSLVVSPRKMTTSHASNANVPERARAEGALPEEGSEDEDEQIKRKRLVTGGQPQDINEWQEKCELLHDKLGRKEGELAQVPLPQKGTICTVYFLLVAVLFGKHFVGHFRWNRWHYLSKSPHHGVFGAKNMIFRRHTTPISPNTKLDHVGSNLHLSLSESWVPKVGEKLGVYNLYPQLKQEPQWTPDFSPPDFSPYFSSHFSIVPGEGRSRDAAKRWPGSWGFADGLEATALGSHQEETGACRWLGNAGDGTWSWDSSVVFGPKKHCLTGEVKLPKMVGEHHCSILSDLSVDSVQL